MSSLLNDVRNEVKSVIGSKTLGAILPPLVFVIANSLFGLSWGYYFCSIDCFAFRCCEISRRERQSNSAVGGTIGSY